MSADKTIEATFCFVDIAGYAALTHTHGELAAADLVDEFAEMIRTSIAPSGELQSLIGDCAFVVFPDPLSAKEALSALYKRIADRQNFPVVRGTRRSISRQIFNRIGHPPPKAISLCRRSMFELPLVDEVAQ